jgi:hypothetical protein
MPAFFLSAWTAAVRPGRATTGLLAPCDCARFGEKSLRRPASGIRFESSPCERVFFPLAGRGLEKDAQHPPSPAFGDLSR